MYLIIGVVFVVVLIVVLAADRLGNQQLRDALVLFICVPILIAIGVGAGILTLLDRGEMKSTVLWEDSIPGNLELQSPQDAPSYTLETHLEKTDRPVYLKVSTWGSIDIHIDFELFDPGGTRIASIPPDYEIECYQKYVSQCSPVIIELSIKESGTYRMRIKSLTSFAHDVTITFLVSDWLDRDIDNESPD